jgi:hypothetical protein
MVHRRVRHGTELVMYQLVRFYSNAGIRRRVLDTHLTLAQVQAHCQNPDTSSSTTSTKTGKDRTRKVEPWFDGYESMPERRHRRRQKYGRI